MPIPMIAAALAPTAIKLGANLFHQDKPSEYEQELSGLADIYGEQAKSPLDQNRIYKEGKRQLDRRDEKNRERVQNASAASGATDEARLASMENNNEAYGAALSRLFNSAQRYRDTMRSRYLNVLGAKENAHRARKQQFNNKLNNIMKPLSSASSAFMMSNLFNEDGVDQLMKETPEATSSGPKDSSIYDALINTKKYT